MVIEAPVRGVAEPAVPKTRPQTLPATRGQGPGGGGRRTGLDLVDRGGGGGNEPPLRPTDREENSEARKHAERFATFWTTSNAEEDLKSFGFEKSSENAEKLKISIIEDRNPPLSFSHRQRDLDSSLRQYTQLTDPAKELLGLAHRVSSALLMVPEEIISLEQLRMEGSNIGIFTSDRILLVSIEKDLLIDLISSLGRDEPSDLVKLAGEEQIKDLISRWGEAIKEEYGPTK